MFNFGFNFFSPRDHQTRGNRRPISINQPNLRRIMIMNIDHDKFFRIGRTNSGKKPGVLFIMHQHIVSLRSSQNMGVSFQWPMIFILRGIKNGTAISSPHSTPRCVHQHFTMISTRAQITNAQIIKFRTLVIIRPSRKFLIWRK